MRDKVYPPSIFPLLPLPFTTTTPRDQAWALPSRTPPLCPLVFWLSIASSTQDPFSKWQASMSGVPSAAAGFCVCVCVCGAEISPKCAGGSPPLTQGSCPVVVSGVTGTHSNANAAYKYGSPSKAILNSGGVKHRVRLPSASPSSTTDVCVCVCLWCRRDVCWSPGHEG